MAIEKTPPPDHSRNGNGPGNVLMVANYPSDTAYAWWLMEQFWLTLADEIQRRGGKAYLAYPEVRGVSEAIQNSAIEVRALSVLAPRGSSARKEALAFIRQHDIRTVYLTDRPWYSLDYLALRMAGVRRILIHDHTPGDRPNATGVKRLLKTTRNRLPWLTADYVFCVSELMRERDIKNGCIPADRCLTVQNGIPPLHSSADRVDTRLALEIPAASCVVITTGRAHPYKRFDFVVRTAAKVRAMDPSRDIRFVLVGDGPALEDLQKLVSELDLLDRVLLLGYRRDTHDLLRAADIAMHAALGEGFSLSVVEYMSASLPVLVPDIPSVKQAIDHEINGFVYPADDVEAAANAIVDLASNEGRRQQMGTAAKRKADDRYALTTCLNAFNLKLRETLPPPSDS